VKFDGGRCHLYFDGTSAVAYSRNGKVIDFCGALDESARLLMKQGEVWDGEVVFRDAKGKFLDRKTSNGHFNRGVKNTMTPEIAKFATFIAWDIVDFSSTLMYADRYDEYNRRWDALSAEQKTNSNIWVAEAKVVKNEKEGLEFYDKCIKHGHEGAILKNIKAVWQPKRTKDLGKMKAVEEADLVVVGWELGSGKNSKRLGNLICETQDGKLRVGVGTGFKDEDRDQSPDYFLDKIVTIKYNQLIQDKKTKEWTMFLPVFVEFAKMPLKLHRNPLRQK
jgi:DNA ligase-1